MTERRPVGKRPVAKFWYHDGTVEHRHPVRRTVLVVADTPTHLVGYELRRGGETRTYRQAVAAGLQTYRKSAVTTYGQYVTLRKTYPERSAGQSTLRRLGLLDLVKEGV